MFPSRVCSTIVVLGLSVAHFSAESRAEEGRFIPEVHFPRPSVAFLSVGNAGEFCEKLSQTLVGRLVTHPRVHQAFAGVLAAIRPHIKKATESVTAVTGKQPAELLEMLSGEIAISFSGIGPDGPEVIAAVELGDNREAILALVDRLSEAFQDATGRKVGTRKIGGIEFGVWPGPPGMQLFAGAAGSHLLLTSSADLAGAVVNAYRGGAAESLGDNPLYKRLNAKHRVADRQMFFMLDLSFVRRRLLGTSNIPPAAQGVPRVLRFIGLDQVSSLSLAVGHKDGGLDCSSYLESHGGTSGLLDVLRRGLPPVESLDAALEKFPARATDLYAVRYRPGFMVGEIVKLAKETFPENVADIDGGIQMLNGMMEFPLVERASKLPDVTAYGAVIPPPAGSLISDRIWLVKTAALEPGWKLLKEWGAALEVQPQSLEYKAGTVRYLNLAAGKLSRGLSIWNLARDPERALGTGANPVATAMVFLTGSTFARADLEDGWSVIANMPQALVRYLYHYKKGERLSAKDDIASVARAQLKGASAGGVTNAGANFLWFYNSVVAGASYFSGLLALAGIDVASLPPGETFHRYVKAGYFRITADAGGFSLRVHRPLASGVAPIFTGAVAAAFVVPWLARGRDEAQAVTCSHHLKQIFMAAARQANQKGGAFPFSRRGGHHGLQKIVEDHRGGLTPELFVCPYGEETPASATPAGFKLTAATCSYEMVPWRVRLGGPASAILIFDKRPHPDGRRNVVFTDGSVRRVQEAEFQELLGRNRQRYGRE